MERITTVPGQFSVTCTKLPGRETELSQAERGVIPGGCILPGQDPLEYYGDIVDDIYGIISEWRG